MHNNVKENQNYLHREPKDKQKTMINYTKMASGQKRRYRRTSCFYVPPQNDILLPSPIISSNQIQINPGKKNIILYFGIHWAIGIVIFLSCGSVQAIYNPQTFK